MTSMNCKELKELFEKEFIEGGHEEEIEAAIKRIFDDGYDWGMSHNTGVLR